MNNRTLGLLALAGAPFFLLSTLLQPYFSFLHEQQFYGIWTTIYITAWMCSVVGLMRLKATGNSKFGKTILWVLLTALLLADFSNLYQVILPGNRSILFMVLDAFWPLSNLLMLVVGITAVVANVLQGWRRFVPLFVGCWLPVMVTCSALFGRTGTTGTIGAYYSAFAWTILAVMIIGSEKNAKEVSTVRYKFA